MWPVAGLNFAYLNLTCFCCKTARLLTFCHLSVICFGDFSVPRALAGATWTRASTEETKTFKTDLMRRLFCQKPGFNEGSAASFQEFQFSFACWYICYTHTHAYYTIRCYIVFCSFLGFFNGWQILKRVFANSTIHKVHSKNIRAMVLTLRPLRYHLTDALPQPNSPPDYVFRTDQLPKETTVKSKTHMIQASVSRNKQNNFGGISRPPELLPMLHLVSHFTKSD